eukprot:GHVS01091909.1.p1 GENE.GHVS01091909.1~~GHVS01091909.1.p1  ORF type:complete len:644 (+),score=175.89 GHVS01091909.1:199-1932(+)
MQALVPPPYGGPATFVHSSLFHHQQHVSLPPPTSFAPPPHLMHSSPSPYPPPHYPSFFPSPSQLPSANGFPVQAAQSSRQHSYQPSAFLPATSSIPPAYRNLTSVLCTPSRSFLPNFVPPLVPSRSFQPPREYSRPPAVTLLRSRTPPPSSSTATAHAAFISLDSSHPPLGRQMKTSLKTTAHISSTSAPSPLPHRFLLPTDNNISRTTGCYYSHVSPAAQSPPPPPSFPPPFSFPDRTNPTLLYDMSPNGGQDIRDLGGGGGGGGAMSRTDSGGGLRSCKTSQQEQQQKLRSGETEECEGRGAPGSTSYISYESSTTIHKQQQQRTCNNRVNSDEEVLNFSWGEPEKNNNPTNLVGKQKEGTAPPPTPSFGERRGGQSKEASSTRGAQKPVKELKEKGDSNNDEVKERSDSSSRQENEEEQLIVRNGSGRKEWLEDTKESSFSTNICGFEEQGTMNTNGCSSNAPSPCASTDSDENTPIDMMSMQPHHQSPPLHRRGERSPKRKPIGIPRLQLPPPSAADLIPAGHFTQKMSWGHNLNSPADSLSYSISPSSSSYSPASPSLSTGPESPSHHHRRP